MISSIISRLVILVFGTLYPAYASYKAVRTKNVKEYVKWMMYWIVFALFTCAETFTDVFCSFWFPFYYEFKVILVLWLLSPATKGSSILYRKFVHPMLTKREQEIDEYIAKAKEQGYHTVLTLGSKGVNYATTVIMQTAIKNLNLPHSVSSFSLLPGNPAPQPIAQTSTVTVEEVQRTSVTRLRETVDETDFSLLNNVEDSHSAEAFFSSDDDTIETFSPTKRTKPYLRRNTRSQNVKKNAKKAKSCKEILLADTDEDNYSS